MVRSTEIDTLVVKAAEAKDSSDAVRFSQAACNVANALQVLVVTDKATREFNKP